MENVTLHVFTLAVDAARAAALPYEEKHFHPDAPVWLGEFSPRMSYEDDHGNVVHVAHEKLPAPHELVRMFPGLRALMRARRRAVRERMAEAGEEAEAELRDSLARIQREPCDKDLLAHVAKQTYKDRMRRHEKELRRVERFLHEPKEGAITDADIARAREYPIEQLIEVKRRDRFVPCIFHDEKTPSMKVFKDNHFHCYGCGEWGDAIDLVMKLDGLRFTDAVKKLAHL